MSWVIKAAEPLTWDTSSGNLEVNASPEYQAELKAIAGRDHGNLSSDAIMHEVFEPLIANGGFDWIAPEEVGALTDAPIIGLVSRDDQGNITGVEELYWFPNYQVKSPIETLANTGTVTFTRGEVEK